MEKFRLTHYDYDFMRGIWEGPKGAAYNVVYEDLREAGLVSFDGTVTEKGREAMLDYEEKLWTI